MRSAALAVAAALSLSAAAQAQSGIKPAVQWELRADALVGPPAGGQIGFGTNIALDSYLRAGLEHRERFFTAAGNRAADAHLALDDQKEPVAGLALAKHILAGDELLIAAHLGHASKLAVVEIFENGDSAEEFDYVSHGDRRSEL